MPDLSNDTGAGRVDLDDPEALRAADATGALLHASMAGAQLRAVATAVEGGALDGLTGFRPRAVVWVSGRSDRARQAAGVVAALAVEAGGPAVPPLVHAGTLPAWVGALDVVLVSGDDAGDPDLAAAIDAAAGRGAAVIVDVPREGLVSEAGRGRASWLEPLPYLPPHRGVLRHLAAGMAVLTALGARGLDVGAAADAVDVELEGIGPELATPVNPAKLLATSVAGRDPLVWIHADAVSAACCDRAVAAFCDAGRITAASSVGDAVRAGAERAQGRPPVDPLADLFHDEELDGPREDMRVRYLGMVLNADEDIVRLAAGPLADVEWVTDRGRDTVGDAPAPLSGKVAAHMARTELSAAYLLVGGL
ncbi:MULTISPECIES: hypothetical protein [Dietzia]|uniref:Phosphoglucose isomerase-like protein n=1 Tax=Dietzia cinnamea TaxID=321318 RepID=A0AAW5Q712_9ACTN|nr:MULTISPECIES: hypothetical protein [Dietzia]KZO57694.1 hypothetical protein A2U19_15580 [Dietzia maris]AVM64765.1 hypothetical protein C3V38_10655 [Dietzia sp. oral taxon 368]MCT1639843.1 hypothetical protein [Dietzia cinnamea]MCT1712666.1 hypothetical protein [Dietzia cinnamea]MCT1865001.1 hypothetical protein [Dietzia cinnamea]